MSGEFNSVREVFEILNRERVDYLVLRNYENLFLEEAQMDEHKDIDILCADSYELAKALGARVYTNKTAQVCNDGTHFYILIDGKEISLDLRHIGDGYYCEKWQNDMLSRKIESTGCYIMGLEDYFYSLIYHSILQKPRLSQDYRIRLSNMAKELGFEEKLFDTKELICMLESYMVQNGYTYTYPTDTFVPLHSRYINRRLIEPNCRLKWKHWKFDVRVSVWHFLVCLKHWDFNL